MDPLIEKNNWLDCRLVVIQVFENPPISAIFPHLFWNIFFDSNCCAFEIRKGILYDTGYLERNAEQMMQAIHFQILVPQMDIITIMRDQLIYSYSLRRPKL
jgi:hypothetical protein